MYEKKIAMGMALLDEKLPGWENQVDLQRLALNDCRRCVVGQLCGDDSYTAYQTFWHQLRVWEIGDSLSQAREYGFALWEGSLDDNLIPPEYTTLTAEWRDAITDRRATNKALAAELQAALTAKVPELTGASV